MATLDYGSYAPSMPPDPKRKAANISTDDDDMALSQINTSHADTDVDTSDDVNVPVSPTALQSAAYYTKDMDVRHFPGMTSLKRTIRMLSNRLAAGKSTTQYYGFNCVPQDIVDRLDIPGVRITYFWDEQVMIVKLPTGEHEISHYVLGSKLTLELDRMQVPETELVGIAATTLRGRRSSKQGDSAFRPLCRPPANKWPTLVIESGYSESLRRLRNDARWWISNSGGEVHTVIIISIRKPIKKLIIEKWCDQPGAFRRSGLHQYPGDSPNRVQELQVSHIPGTPIRLPTSYNVSGAPLRLPFDKILLRPPVPPHRNTLYIRASALRALAVAVWGSTA